MMNNRIYLILISILIPLSIWGQHARFYDHPIDGPISKFDKMLLQEEDFTTSGSLNNNGSGTNSYDGKFLGLPCKLFVYYDPKEKNVYRVRVMIPVKTEEAALRWLGNIVEPLIIYYDLDLEESTHGDYPSLQGYMMDVDHITPGRHNIFDYTYDVGWVELFIGKAGNQYGVLFDIYDIANCEKYDKFPENIK